jgi:prepilin-type N-terminal cleavage/methylation domain-containing protein
MSIFQIKNRINCKHERGFTLVESLVAISVFSLSVLAMMIVLGKGIADTEYVKKKMIATYLAQEGIEYIRNLKDDYVLYSSDPSVGWNTFTGRINGCTTANGCYMDDQSVSYSDSTIPMTDMTLAACVDTTCATHPIYYNAATARYSLAAVGTNIGFTRKITLNYIDSNNARFTSTVYWIHAGLTSSVSFTENVTNWTE